MGIPRGALHHRASVLVVVHSIPSTVTLDMTLMHEHIQIALRLADQGVVIARRTVAKYREAAGIEPAILRKARAALESS